MIDNESKPLILIVDDDDSIRTLLKLAIKNKGYLVEEATNGEEALSVYQRCQPDLVLLDAVMPLMDGFTCCQKLCAIAQENNQEIPILMLTFLDDQTSIDQAFEAGATDYITKPIYWAVLFQRVNRLLSAHQNNLNYQKAKIELKQLQTYQDLFRNILHSECFLEQNILDQIRSCFAVDRAIFHQLKSKSTLQSCSDNLSTFQLEDISDLTLLKNYNSQYQQGELLSIVNIDNLSLSDKQITLFNSYKIKSFIVVPLINQKQQLLALLCLYQSSKTHNWQDLERQKLIDLTKLFLLKNK